jgi:hypothetical protein
VSPARLLYNRQTPAPLRASRERRLAKEARLKSARVGATGYVGSRLLAESAAMIDELENPRHGGRRFTVGY